MSSAEVIPSGASGSARSRQVHGATAAEQERWIDEAFGHSVAIGPDLDGDGRADVLVGAPVAGANQQGRVYVFSGATGTRLRVLNGNQAYMRLGVSISLGPDADGDGRGDILAGAPSGYPNPGLAQLFSGATGSLLFTWGGTDTDGGMGESVSLGPDVDGDGRADALVGVPGAPERGRAELRSGATGALLRTFRQSDTTIIAYGSSVSLGPDTDCDGRGDVAIGTPNPWDWRGAMFLYSGASGTHLGTWRTSAFGSFAFSVSLGPDADGDGRADLASAESDTGISTGALYVFGSSTVQP